MITVQNEKRVLTYVTGLLHFFGAMTLNDLFLRVSEVIKGIDRKDFQIIVEQNVLDDHSPYVFDLDEDVCFDIEVDDSEWVLEQQHQHGAVPFRTINEDEAACIVDDRYPLLWSSEELAFFTWLEERCGNDGDLALALILDYAALLKNGLAPLELAKKIVKEMELSGVEEVQEAAEIIVEFAAATPLWTLKGWRENEVALEDTIV